jgi:type I restriction enzyme, S subunit
MVVTSQIDDGLLVDLPDGWAYARLSTLVDDRGISYGVVQPGSDDTEGIPIVRVNNLKDHRIATYDAMRVSRVIEAKYQRTRLRGGEVLISLVGSLGEIAVVPSELAGWNVARAIGVIPVRSDVGADWVSICLRSATVQHYIRTWATTTVQATLNLKDVANLPIPIPPRHEREVIAHILGTLDDKIELNRKMNQTLEAMARAIFKSWFVDFDPVRAKAEGRDPGLPADLAALFPESFEDSELGEIPKGWKIQSIVDLAELNSWTLSKSDVLNRIEYIEISEVSKGNIGTIQVYKRGEEPSRARRRLRHGDTILSTVRPDRGSYFLCLNPTENQIASTGFAVFTPKKTPWSLLHAALTQDELFERLGHLADGGAYPAIRPEVIGEWQLPMPDSTAITDAFHRICGSLYEKAEQNRRESRHLVGLRDALLPKLLSGEIRMKDSDRLVETI